MDLEEHLKNQIEFSKSTFGEGYRVKAVINHIQKELVEIENDPNDLEEWIDVILLALDGAWRSGHNPRQICEMLAYKLNKNINREWPDHIGVPDDQPIEHLK